MRRCNPHDPGMPTRHAAHADAPRATPTLLSRCLAALRGRRARIALFAALSIGAASAAALPLAEAHFAAHGPPGARALPEPKELRGRVIERLDAGRYGYLRVAESGRPDVWLVVVSPRVRAGDTVIAEAYAKARDFESRRLQRTFEELYFGTAKLVAP